MTLHRTPGQRNRVRDGAVLANKKRVIKMLVIVVLLFSLSWLPYQVHLFRITLIKLLVFSSCFVLYTIFVSLCLKTNSMIMPSSLFHSCFSCIALSSLFLQTYFMAALMMPSINQFKYINLLFLLSHWFVIETQDSTFHSNTGWR